MPVVCNTSPISNLAIIDRLDLLRAQFGMVIIPEAVSRELRALQNIRAKARILAAFGDGWLEVRTVTATPLIQLLTMSLHEGESEALALAVEIKASWLLLDEREARAAAKRMDLPVTGVMGILLKAKKTGVISAIRPELKRLREEAHFFISSSLEEHILRLAGE